MPATMPRALFWTPRVLSFAFALFLSIFALDVFESGRGFWKTLAALGMHLLPSLLVLLVLAVAWRRELVGAIAFAGLGVLYLVTSWGRFDWSAYACISGPLFLVGGLFLANWLWKRRNRDSTCP